VKRWPLVWRSTLGLERLRGDLLKDRLEESQAALRLCRRENRDLQQQITVLLNSTSGKRQ